MAGKTKDPEFRHPDAVAYLKGLTDKEAAEHLLLVHEADGVVIEYWREGGRVRCREVKEPPRAGARAPETDALREAAESTFARSLSQMMAELRGNRVPDLNALETTIHDDVLGSGAKGLAAVLEALDAELPAPSCPDCRRRMERHARVGTTFQTRLGPVRVERMQFRCGKCGAGCFPLDRALDLEGKAVTPGEESIRADAAGSGRQGKARRKPRNLGGK